MLKRTDRLQDGHISVVSRILNNREILVEHANWLNRGQIHKDMLVRDTSADNDWSAVRVWYTPGRVLGKRTYPAHGFIHPARTRTVQLREPPMQGPDVRVLQERLERVRHRQNQKGDSQGSQKVIQAMSWVKGGQPWMTRPYSEDLRERVVRVVESGTSRNAAAKQFDVSISFVVKLMQRWKQRGTIKADKYGGWKKSNLAPHGDRIRALVMENCDITIDELCVLLAAEGIEAKRSTLGDFLLAQGLSRKKRQPTPPSRSALTSRRREPLGATSNLG